MKDAYDSEGIRKSKCVNGEVTEYFTDGSKILYEKHNDYDIYYFYDELNKVQGFEYNGNTYFYVTNIVNDIIGIIDINGEWIVTYSYDAWGNVVSISGDEELARINPFRYKGYYYDEESGFYYLNSRYYDSTTGRFINADKHIETNVGIHSNNMFAYCENSPITSSNSGGEASSSYVGEEGAYNYVALWSSSMSNYNCYAYAINYSYRKINPGVLYSGSSAGFSLDALVAATKKDLEKLGYKYVYEINRSQINSYSGTVIALRLDTKGSVLGVDLDYHWMKYVRSSNAWLHKPGATAILRYKTAENTNSWKGESFNGNTGKWKINELITYTGEIRYIVYK